MVRNNARGPSGRLSTVTVRPREWLPPVLPPRIAARCCRPAPARGAAGRSAGWFFVVLMRQQSVPVTEQWQNARKQSYISKPVTRTCVRGTAGRSALPQSFLSHILESIWTERSARESRAARADGMAGRPPRSGFINSLAATLPPGRTDSARQSRRPGVRSGDGPAKIDSTRADAESGRRDRRIGRPSPSPSPSRESRAAGREALGEGELAVEAVGQVRQLQDNGQWSNDG
jgi:hypothetical protein